LEDIVPEGHFNKKRHLLEEAINTLRDLPTFGHADYEEDFRWPKPEHLIDFPVDQPIAVSAIKWKQSE